MGVKGWEKTVKRQRGRKMRERLERGRTRWERKKRRGGRVGGGIGER